MAKSEDHGTDEAEQVMLMMIDGITHTQHERSRSPIMNSLLLLLVSCQKISVRKVFHIIHYRVRARRRGAS
jgi:hypothetical protein